MSVMFGGKTMYKQENLICENLRTRAISYKLLQTLCA